MNKQRKRKLGLVTEILPAMSFNLLDERIIPFDEGKDITFDNISLYVSEFLENKLESIRNKPKRSTDTELRKSYKDTPPLLYSEFHSKVLTEGTDVLVLFYSSYNNQKSYDIAPYFNKVAKRFGELEFPNVKVYGMDVALESVPKNIKIEYIPAIYFFPSFHKEPPHTYYSGEGKVLPLILFVQHYADIPFELPPLPHLSPDQIEAYYQQKAELSIEKQKQVEAANERTNWEL